MTNNTELSPKKKLGFIGARGMVGRVLLERMREEDDFRFFETFFFSTSQVGQAAPPESHDQKLRDAHSLDELSEMDVIVTCQGGDYTLALHPSLRAHGWKGVWVDAASALRMNKDSCLVLDPLNKDLIKESLEKGVVDYVGSNCTVSLMLLALAGPLKAGVIEWVNSHTYQAASGGGAAHMRELLKGMGFLYERHKDLIDDERGDILKLDQLISKDLRENNDFPSEKFGAPLAANLLPWIDSAVNDGQTREEWKAMVEANKILGLNNTLGVDGTCVRVGALRSHSQALTIKLKKPMGAEEFSALLKDSHEWLEFVENNKEETLRELTPAAASGTLRIKVGRVRALKMAPDFMNVFTVGDQLLWGAAEPLRRFLRQYVNH